MMRGRRSYADKKRVLYSTRPPREIKGLFLIRTRRSLGLTAHRDWARLLINRMDTQVHRPECPETPEPA